MRPMSTLLRVCFALLGAFVAVSYFASPAFAQKKNDDPPPADNTRYWTAGYGIALMGVVLGLLIVLRPGTRGGDEQQ